MMDDVNLTNEGMNDLQKKLKDYSTRAKLPPDTVLRKALRDAFLTLNHLRTNILVKQMIKNEDKELETLTKEEASSLFNRCVALSNGMFCIFCGLREKCNKYRTMGNQIADAYKVASEEEIREANIIIDDLAKKSLEGDEESDKKLQSKDLAIDVLNQAKENLKKGK